MKYINKINFLGDYYKYKLNGPYTPGVNMIHDTTNIIYSSKIDIPPTYPLFDTFIIRNAVSTLEDNKNTNYNILFLRSFISASNIVDVKNNTDNNVIGQYSESAQQMQGYYLEHASESLTGYLHNNTYRQPLKVINDITDYMDPADILSVILPDTVETIGASAFCDASNLTEINLENVKYIGADAFYQPLYSNIRLHDLNLENIEYISCYAFNGCNGVNNIIIGNKIKYLEDYIFTPSAGATLTIKSKIFPETYDIENIFDISSYNNFSLYIPVKYDEESYLDFLDYFCTELDIPLNHKIQGTYDSYISAEKYLVDYDTPFVRYSGILTNINGIDELTGERLINASSPLPAKNAYLSKNTTGSIRTITLTGQVNGINKTFEVKQGYNPTINISSSPASTTTTGFYTAPNNAWQYEYIDSTTGSPKKYRKFSSNCANINSGYSTMTITVKGCDTFTIYLRNYSESYYDYIMASKLDTTINQNTIYNNTNVAGHCYSYSADGDNISGLTKVTYENLAFNQHTITIVYKKDAGDNQGDDAGYVYIPDDGNLVFSSTIVKEPTVAKGFFNVYLPTEGYTRYTAKSVELFSAVTSSSGSIYNNIYVHNPDIASSRYVYVNSNVGAEADDSLCIMRLDLYDIEDFTVYIKQRTESNYDFVVLSGLDSDIQSFIQTADNTDVYSTYDITSEVYVSFDGVLSDEYGSLGDDDSWTAVEYNIKEYEESYQSYIHYDSNYPNKRYHWIYVLYRKDYSGSSNGDYVHVFIREDPSRIITDYYG